MSCALVVVLVVAAACSAPTAPSATASGETTQRTRREPATVDSHVHLAFYPVADQLAANGVRAVVDLAAPESTLGAAYPIQVIQSGPMLTRPGGYPLDSWGADGYGIGCADEPCIAQSIDRLRKRGARVIKLALDDGGLAPPLAKYATSYAQARNLKVVAHALTDSSVMLAGVIGVDVLAHTPLEPLSRETLRVWRAAATNAGPRAVITTLAAFGGSQAALDNLARLRDAGLVVLYGTDLGNLRVDGVSPDEIALIRRAGLDQAAIDAALTTAPWQFWGFDSR